MNVEEYEKMYRMEEHSWWFRGRQAIVEGLLRQSTEFGERSLRILDIGCGTGKILRDFSALGHTVVGLDFSDRALEFTAQRGGDLLIRGDAQLLPIATGSFDLVIALDVLEHVPHDDAMAAEIYRVLKPGGHAVLNVPAHPSLWSEHDEALHHFRRYTRRAFRDVLTEAGFELRRLTYSICSIYPVALVFRTVGKMRPRRNGSEPKSHMFRLPRFFNECLVGVLRTEAAIIRRMNMPFGLSLLTLARKPGDATAEA